MVMVLTLRLVCVLLPKYLLQCAITYLPTTLKSILAEALIPFLVATQVCVPVSPEWIAARVIELDVADWKGQLLQVDDHW